MIDSNVRTLIQKLISTIACIAVTLAAAHIGLGQSSTSEQVSKDAKRIDKVRKDVAAIGLGGGITVSRVDNRDFFGNIQKIGSDDFEVADADANTVHVFKYADIRNVRPGAGVKNRITGKRSNSRTRKVLGWAGIGALAALFVVIIVGLSDDDF
jgi:hypothetical protein